MKDTAKWIAQINDVLPIIDGLDLDARSRATIRRALSEAIVEAEDRMEFEYQHRHSQDKWKETDIETLTISLKKAKDCASFEEEHMTLDCLAMRLGRPQKSVKKKAIELGFGKKVDYWINHKHAL